MSRIAQECDYAVGTLCRQFASREDPLVALATRNCMSPVELYGRAARWNGPTRERMLAITDLMVTPHAGRAQYVFTDVIWHAASERARLRSLEISALIGVLIKGITAEALRQRPPAGTGPTPQTLTIGPWTLCMGMHTLVHAEGVLERHDVDAPYRLLVKHPQHLLNGYGWQPLFDVSDERRSTHSWRASAATSSTHPHRRWAAHRTPTRKQRKWPGTTPRARLPRASE